MNSPPGQLGGPREHVVEHVRGEPAGEGVLLTRVVAAQQSGLITVRARKHRLGAVPEARFGSRRAPARLSEA